MGKKIIAHVCCDKLVSIRNIIDHTSSIFNLMGKDGEKKKLGTMLKRLMYYGFLDGCSIEDSYSQINIKTSYNHISKFKNCY